MTNCHTRPPLHLHAGSNVKARLWRCTHAKSSIMAKPRALRYGRAMQDDSLVAAQDCTTMAQVRAGIDALDMRIVTLLARRMRYIEAAARIKPSRDTVRDEWRKAQVIDHAADVARAHDFPEQLVRAVYEVLVEGSIAHEFVRFDERER